MKFTTQNGTVFELNRQEMTWRRVSRTERSGVTRSESGRLVTWPIIEIGRSAYLQDDNIRPGFDGHFVTTSPVISIEEEDTIQ